MDGKKTFEKLFKSKNAITVLVVVGFIGILLIFLSEFISSDDNDNKSISVTGTSTSDADYCLELENKIKELVSGMTGDENISVAVTLKNGTEYVYATESGSQSPDGYSSISNFGQNGNLGDKSGNSYIIIKTEQGEQPLLLSALSPSVRGVAIVCDSGGNEIVEQQIKSSVGVLLNLSESRISVTGCGRQQ